MIPLSPRLLCCASMVRGDYVCDVGTDHAYLPAYLINAGKCSRALATDIRTGPLESARGTLRRFQSAGKIKLILSDGFAQVPQEPITDAVLAGMGGETIRDILAAGCAHWLRTEKVNLVLQPMTKAEVLRRWLAENGFTVTRETVVKDSHVYLVMQAVYTGGVREISDAETYHGILNRKDILTTIYIADIQKHLHTKARGLEDSGQTEEAEKIRRLIRDINNWMQEEQK